MSGVERLPLATRDGRANLIRAFKASGCVQCGRRYPELDWSELHIDHIDPSAKPRDDSVVGNARRGGGLAAQKSNHGSARILAELLLCQVLCMDCHREKHRQPGSASIEGQLSMFNGTGGWRYE